MRLSSGFLNVLKCCIIDKVQGRIQSVIKQCLNFVNFWPTKDGSRSIMIILDPYPYPHLRRSGSTTLFGERWNWTQYKFALGIETWLLLGYRNKTDIPWASQIVIKTVASHVLFKQTRTQTTWLPPSWNEGKLFLVILVYTGILTAFGSAICAIVIVGYLENPLKSSVAYTGCVSRIPDPNFFHPGSRIPDPHQWI